MTSSIYTCPVCGYDNLAWPRYDGQICPSCGTEFGYDDFNKTVEQLRQAWIENGMNWCDHSRRPKNWDAAKQLKKLLGA